MAVTNISIDELKAMIKEGSVEIIDVREPYEHAEHHIKNDKLIPMSLVPLKINEIDWSKKVVLYCRTGSRSAMLAQMLAGQGKNIYNLSPGVIRQAIAGDTDLLKINS